MSPEMREQLLAIAARSYLHMGRVAGVTGVTAAESPKSGTDECATRVTPVTPALLPAIDLEEGPPLPDSAPCEGMTVSRRRKGRLRAVEQCVARLSAMDAPPGFSPTDWDSSVEIAKMIACEWTAQAFDCGWSTEDLFGLHPTAPAARRDVMGLAFVLRPGDKILSLDETSAIIQTPQGAMQKFHRGPENNGVCAWSLRPGPPAATNQSLA
jgi:hypothetical protein